MAQNKKSIWSAIILIAAIVTLGLLIASVVVTSMTIPTALEAAKQAAIAEGMPAADAEIAAYVVVGAVIAALVLGSALDVLKVIGGFMFSLKGRWGIFCIIVSILSVGSGIWTLVNDISNKAGTAAIVISVVSLAVSALLCVACFMHRAENNR